MDEFAFAPCIQVYSSWERMLRRHKPGGLTEKCMINIRCPKLAARGKSSGRQLINRAKVVACQSKQISRKAYMEKKQTERRVCTIGEITRPLVAAQELIGGWPWWFSNYSVLLQIASQLHQLTEKGNKFLWSAECHAAFNTLKGKLSSPPILAFPNFSPSAGPFILDTDASDPAIGAVLSQKSANGEVVIAYASRRLNKRERRYCTTCRGMSALVYFLEQFRPYLLGKPSKVRTDHQALQWLRNIREPEGQVARCLEYLQDYDFNCIHRSGSRHANTDALFLFPTETVNAILSTPSVEVTWAHYQLNDPYPSNIYRRQLDGNPKHTGREIVGRSPVTHQSKSQHHQKSRYDRTANRPVYRIGDHVWLYGPKPPLGAAHKVHRPWLSPFVIVHVRSPTVYVIRDITNPTVDVLTVQYNQLKPAQTSEEAQMRPLPVPPVSVPIAEQTVEIPAKGGCSNIGGTKVLESASLRGEQCNDIETVAHAI
ncbi:uncharacterized protein DEA37_0010775 [Paragonimus westermani]|uniref:Reverse transcriptase RNase H-like domain-containing protein n=1 Tax=Paragonimus westermani TaxID=34504 RepID=A0A5J4NML1_9TREM|nr:uncharacterized protein DEA37_0010775 [Paragonimus westermani]